MKVKNLVVDLFGVLFLVNKKSILYQLGLWNVTAFYIRFWKSPLDHCLFLLDKMRLEVPGEFQEIVAYKGFYLPESLCRWQKGLLSNKQALTMVTDYFDSLDQSICYNRAVMKHVASILFSTKTLSKAVYLNIHLYQQLIKLKKKYSLFLLSNIDLQTWEYIQKTYPEVVNLFDGTTTSGIAGLLKPDALIFHHLLDTYKLNPTQCILIDDQFENCEKAVQLGFSCMQYQPGKIVKNYF